MAYDVGYVDDSGSEGVAHWQFLLKIKALAEANGWTTLRYLNPAPYTDATVVRELILQGVGLSGTEQIFIGFRAWQSQTADYYNMSVAAFTGYVSANPFVSQPGYMESGFCAHNQRIDYWLVVNAQRIALALRIGAGAYQTAYVGKFLPYGTPSQYPYPVACIAMLNGAANTRYSDGSYGMGLKGYTGAGGNLNYYGPNCRIRDVAGTWQQAYCAPWQAGYYNATRDTGGFYVAKKIVLYNTNNVWGELQGFRFISGFNQAVESTCAIDGKTNVVFRDVTRTGFQDYCLLELS
ncbi:MAG: hypothetical protein WA777_01730 [Rhodanobacter sp.]